MMTNKQRGVSLIELLVSITIGLILLAGVLSIFFSSKVTYFANEKTARLQENGRVALDLISHDVRSAGYLGCAHAVPFHTTLNAPNSLLWNFEIPLQGFESDGTGTWAPIIAAGTLDPAPIPDGDVIVTRGVARDAHAARVQTTPAGTTADPSVLATAATAIAPGFIMIISDCKESTAFQVTGVAPGVPNSTLQHAVGAGDPGNSTDDLDHRYPLRSTVTPLQTTIYYVANDPVSGEPSLFRQSGSVQPADLLIEGVQALQLAYGEDTTGDRMIDRYVSAANVTNWDNVLSVTLAMLIRSAEQGTDVDAKSYQLLPATMGGKTLGPYNDRRMRMVFTSTISLRNRAP